MTIDPAAPLPDDLLVHLQIGTDADMRQIRSALASTLALLAMPEVGVSRGIGRISADRTGLHHPEHGMFHVEVNGAEVRISHEGTIGADPDDDTYALVLIRNHGEFDPERVGSGDKASIAAYVADVVRLADRLVEATHDPARKAEAWQVEAVNRTILAASLALAPNARSDDRVVVLGPGIACGPVAWRNEPEHPIDLGGLEPWFEDMPRVASAWYNRVSRRTCEFHLHTPAAHSRTPLSAVEQLRLLSGLPEIPDAADPFR